MIREFKKFLVRVYKVYEKFSIYAYVCMGGKPVVALDVRKRGEISFILVELVRMS